MGVWWGGGVGVGDTNTLVPLITFTREGVEITWSEIETYRTNMYQSGITSLDLSRKLTECYLRL